MSMTAYAPLRSRLLDRPPILDVRDVVVTFGGLTAVDVDEMTVTDGRVVGVIGANGAGKTTLFDVISGFVTPDRGSVVLAGQTELVGLAPGARSLAGLGRSFQNAALFESMTVAETLAVAFERSMRGQGLLSSMLGLPWSRRAERAVGTDVEELVEALGLGAFHDKFISELSTGSRRIVDIACLMAHRPRLLLLDEPSSGIAQREVEALEALLRRVKERLGCTLLVIEHDIPLIRSLADELYAMETGRIISHGTPDEVLTDPEVIHSYLGTDATAVERSGRVSESLPAPVSAPSSNGHRQPLPDTVGQLRELARELGIPGRSRMRKAALVEAINDARGDPTRHSRE